MVTNFGALCMKNRRFTLKFAKTTPNRGIFHVFELRGCNLVVILSNLRVKCQFFVDRTLKFVIKDPKNVYRPHLDTQIANTSKIPFSRGSFCNFKGEAPISYRKDPDICDHT